MNSKGIILFPSKPSLISSGVTVGPLEKQSVFANAFDKVYDSERLNKDTNEQGHMQMIQDACKIALKKANIDKSKVDFFFGGDLVNQMTPTNFAASKLQTPYVGLFSACATSMSAVIMASIMTELNVALYTLAGAASQHNAIERQFRYPIDYGGQKPATAQWTVTAAGYAVIGRQTANCPSIEAATVGKVMDYQQTNPFHMGAAMAPAAFDTLTTHLQGRQQKISDYDLVMTGDLGKIGLEILKGMLEQSGMTKSELKVLRDAGAEFYGEDQKFLAGASGAGCSASVFFSEVLQQMKNNKFKKVLLIATGALLSPLTVQQGETIPCIAHGIELSIG